MILNDFNTVTTPRFQRNQLAIQQRRDNRPVLVALDGGRDAEQAIPFAQALAKRWQAPLRLIHVRNPVDESFGRDLFLLDDSQTLSVHSRPGAYLTGLAESLQAATGLSVESRVISGVSIAETLRSVCQSDARALAMVRTQRSALSRLFSSSVADNLIGRLSVPLLVVPASQGDGPGPLLDAQKVPFTRLLAYLDGSDVEAKLLKCTVATAPDNGVCQLLRVLPLSSPLGSGAGGYLPTRNPRHDAWIKLFKARRFIERQGKSCEPRLVFAAQSAPSAIVDRAQAIQADLIVMAAHPHLLPWWLREGGVENVIRRTTVPVLVVPGSEGTDAFSSMDDDHSPPPGNDRRRVGGIQAGKPLLSNTKDDPLPRQLQYGHMFRLRARI